MILMCLAVAVICLIIGVILGFIASGFSSSEVMLLNAEIIRLEDENQKIISDREVLRRQQEAREVEDCEGSCSK